MFPQPVQRPDDIRHAVELRGIPGENQSVTSRNLATASGGHPDNFLQLRTQELKRFVRGGLVLA